MWTAPIQELSAEVILFLPLLWNFVAHWSLEKNSGVDFQWSFPLGKEYYTFNEINTGYILY